MYEFCRVIKDFKHFAKPNNIEINNELEGTELVLFNLNYDENSNDKLKPRIPL